MLSLILSLETANVLLTFVGINTHTVKDSNNKITALSVYDGFCTIHQTADKIKRVLGNSFRVTTFTNSDTITIKAVQREF